MSFQQTVREDADETQRMIAAAYPDPTVARTVVVDLVAAGMSSADVTLMSPWPVDAPRQERSLVLDHPLLVRLVSALVMGLIASGAALLWASPDRWPLYGIIGAVLGAVSISFASAVAATSPPHWHEALLGDPLGAVTVEVKTTDLTSAEVAQVVMSQHDPALVQTITEPGPRPPSERVLWEHRDGLSPLEELDSWVTTRSSKEKRPQTRGRHLQVDRP